MVVSQAIVNLLFALRACCVPYSLALAVLGVRPRQQYCSTHTSNLNLYSRLLLASGVLGNVLANARGNDEAKSCGTPCGCCLVFTGLLGAVSCRVYRPEYGVCSTHCISVFPRAF